ncbi:MAG: thiamine pyrophosphate-dependent dehydrogenase E1 component subunit alpha [Verrucomicrobiales bacterium]|nr:thiamine pyrophosphate-dependent dehydrogenase E1 component subunit alpha [Verrucomicrobiales bacterium]
MPERFSQSAPDIQVSRDRFVDAYRWMFLARTFEDKIGALYRAGKVVGGVYLGRGQEAFSVALGMQLDQKSGDVFAGLIRDQGGRMAFGESILDAARTYLGSVEGPMRGRDGNIHRGRPAEGLPAMISHLGSSVSVVNGMMIAKRFRGKTSCIAGVTAGDGCTSTGAFHEGVNQAAVEKLPVVIAVADNQFAYSTPTTSQYACEDLVDRAIGYGIPSYSIDGTNLDECLRTFQEAAEKARSGEGPQFVVGKLLRLSGHGEHDDAKYVPDSVRAGKYGKDCLVSSRAMLLSEGYAEESALKEIEAEAVENVEAVVSQSQSEKSPSPVTDDWSALSTSSLVEGQR